MDVAKIYSEHFGQIPWLSLWPILFVGLVGLGLLTYFIFSPKQKTLTAIFVVVIPGFTLVGVSAMFLAMLVSNYHQYVREERRQLQASLQMLNNGIVQKLMQGLYLDASNLLQELNVAGTLKGSAILSPDGQLLAESPANFFQKGKSYGEVPLVAGERERTRWGTLLLVPDFDQFRRLEEERLAQMITLGLSLGGALMLFSFFLSRLLLSRVASVTEVLEHLKRSIHGAETIEDLHARLENIVPGKLLLKETHELDKMVKSLIESLKRTSERIVKLESKAELGRFASQLAHDIRSPLATLRFATDDVGVLPERTRHHIHSSISRIEAIAKGLLEKKRAIENGTLVDISPRRELLAPLIEAMVEEARARYGNVTGIVISAEVPDSARHARSVIEAEAFQRVLSNLINNAVEALPSAGGEVEVRLETNCQRHMVTVTDSGIGISSERLHEIRTIGGTFGKTNGNGLGLSDAKAKVFAWGGELEIQSELGKGTCVTLLIPDASREKS